MLSDRRGENRYLRATWHPATRTIVLSHWSGDICTASTRLALADSPQLIAFLVAALHHAATAPFVAQSATVPGSLGTRTARLLRGLRDVWGGRRAQVLAFCGRSSAAGGDGPRATGAQTGTGTLRG